MSHDEQSSQPSPSGGDSPPDDAIGMGRVDEATIHLAILEALADGVDPLTGEELPGESVFRDAKVLAALAAGMAALGKEHERRERHGKMPGKAGKPWDPQEDARLAEAFDEGTPIKTLAERHGRTPGAIKSRLARLGKLLP